MSQKVVFTASLLVAVSSLWSTRTPAGSTEEKGKMPSYYSLLDFNLTSPGAMASAVGGFANPAVYRMLPGGEVAYFWSDERAQFKSIKRWGLFLGSPHLGFGVVRERMPSLTGIGETKITDFRAALSMGDKSKSIGFGYGWSSGSREELGRKGVFQIGTIKRFGRYASFGLAGAFSTGKNDRKGLVDFALRPLGNSRLSLFGDAELRGEMRVGDAVWSVGALFEPLPGVKLVGRYFEDETFALSFGFSFGGIGALASPRFDADSNLGYTLYGIRTGYGERNVFDEYLARDRAYLKLDLKGRMKYRKYRFFSEEAHTLYGTISSLEDAGKDPRVRGVAINLSGAQISTEKAWEIREKLRELKRGGKHVVVFVDRPGMKLYHLASVADRIVMDPDGDLELPGYVAGRTYMKNLLEKLGLGYDEWRFFKYKSAFESLSRENMSEPDSVQWFAWISDCYDVVKSGVSQARGVSPEEFDRWVNDIVVFFPPESALAVGLVDKLGRWEDVKDVIKELEGSGKRYLSPKKLAGRAFPSKKWGENPRIAIVYALGICDMDRGIKARKLEKVFQRLRDDSRVKGVVFRVDSPGGDGMASDVVAEALRKCAKKKPVIVTQGDVAGSGGYWISMYGDTILAGPTTITGSIGVIGGWVWNKNLGEKLGLTSDHVQVGDHADIGYGIVIPFLGIRVPDRNLDSEERSKVETFIKLFYDEFVRKVAKGRDMPEGMIREIAQGRIWSGVDGKENGLVDMIGGLDTAIKIAREAAGLETDEEVDIVEYPKMGLFDLSFLRKARPFPFSTGVEEESCTHSLYEWSYLRAIIKSRGRPVYMVPPGIGLEELEPVWE